MLLLDEPFSAVDQVTRDRLKRELVQLRSTLQIPVILVTHDIGEAYALADRIVVLQRGRTLADGAPDDIRLRPPSPTVAKLMGQSNMFDGVVEARSRAAVSAGPAAMGKLRWTGGLLDISDTGPFAPGDRVVWLVPTDQIVLHRRGRPSLGERENPVQGIVSELSTLGEHSDVRIALGGSGSRPQNLALRIATHAARRNGLCVGADVSVSLLAEGIHLMPREEAGA